MPFTSSGNNLWYADSNAPMSVNTISAVEATSLGNAIDELYMQSVIKVANAAGRDDTFPEPKQGDAVWRLDLGWEERYFDTYSSKTNTAGKPQAGWYRINSGPNAGKKFGSFNIPTGVASYPMDAAFVADANIGNFVFWEIKYSFITSASTVVTFQFRNAGATIVTSQYRSTKIYNSAAAPVSSTATAGNVPLDQVSGTLHSGTILLSDILTKNNPKFNISTYTSSPTTGMATGMIGGFYNSTVQTIDGFIFAVNTGTLSGGFTIAGYN